MATKKTPLWTRKEGKDPEGGPTKGSHTINIPLALVLFAGNGSIFVRR